MAKETKLCFYCDKGVGGKGTMKMGKHYCCMKCHAEHSSKGSKKKMVCEFC